MHEIVVQGVERTYRSGGRAVHALGPISLEIETGRTTTIVGPSGCGKTTLLRILAGEEQPDRGSVARTPASLRLGYLPQGLELDPQLSLEQVLRPASADLDALQSEVERLAAERADESGQMLGNRQSRFDRAVQRRTLRDEQIEPLLLLAEAEEQLLGRIDLAILDGRHDIKAVLRGQHQHRGDVVDGLLIEPSGIRSDAQPMNAKFER